MFRLQSTIVPDPAVRKLGFGGAFMFRSCGPLLQGLEIRWLAEAFVVEIAIRGARIEAPFAGDDVFFGFD